MVSVSDGELEAFAKIIMQTTLYKTGALEDLAGLSHIYVAHITSEVPWNVSDSFPRCFAIGVREQLMVALCSQGYFVILTTDPQS